MRLVASVLQPVTFWRESVGFCVNFFMRVYFFYSVFWIRPFLYGSQYASTSLILFVLSSGTWYIFGFDDSLFMFVGFFLLKVPGSHSFQLHFQWEWSKTKLPFFDENHEYTNDFAQTSFLNSFKSLFFESERNFINWCKKKKLLSLCAKNSLRR